MKKIIYFELLYWFSVLLILSFIIKSISYSFGASFFIATAILVGMIVGKVLYKQIDYGDLKLGVLNSIYLALVVLLVEYLTITLTHLYLPLLQTDQCPEILINPFFLWIVSIAFIIVDELLLRLFFADVPLDKYIEFTSDRRRVKLLLDSILLVESNDDEVWIRTISHTSFRTKMKISHWENLLDSRFVRVHRSYIVNKNHILGVDASEVKIGDCVIPISRKYKGGLI